MEGKTEINVVGDALATALIRSEAVQFGEFTLRSGEKSDIYVDCRRLMTHWLAAELGTLMERHLIHQVGPALEPKGLQDLRFAGVADGGIPLVTLMVRQSIASLYGWAGGWVRKSEKEHGVTGLLAGNLKAGDWVILLEDVVTSGGSSKRAIEDLAKNDIRVYAVVALLDRTPDGKSPFDVPFYPMLTLDELRKRKAL